MSPDGDRFLKNLPIKAVKTLDELSTFFNSKLEQVQSQPAATEDQRKEIAALTHLQKPFSDCRLEAQELISTNLDTLVPKSLHLLAELAAEVIEKKSTKNRLIRSCQMAKYGVGTATSEDHLNDLTAPTL